MCDSEVNQTKIKGGCQSGSKVLPHDSKSDLPLAKVNQNHMCIGNFMLFSKNWLKFEKSDKNFF